FKNFRRPVTAIDEMFRVLRPGGTAVIQDLRKDASSADIAEEVRKQGLRGLSAFITKRILSGLRRRAYTSAQFERLVAESAFRSGVIRTDGIGIEVRLTKTGSQP
ncbi:MAG TPA: class I SAM-dependent methyltransferase, partial [Candidatus Angelobacter sp.]|nr:class I SAM-dependent methyltransferase [Candidatus Angelobacter sp.]